MAVLLVEDDPIVRVSLAEFLEQAGLVILEAGDAEEALILLGDPVQRITALVTDLNLGPGEDGLVLAAKARHILPDLQVIYATGSPDKLIGHRGSAWETIFLKPFDPAALAAAVVVLAGPVVPPRRRQASLAGVAAASSR